MSANEPQIIPVSIAERSFGVTNTVAWYEEALYLQPAIITKTGGLLTEDVDVEASELNWDGYGKTWRMWKDKPSREQRLAMPLEGGVMT